MMCSEPACSQCVVREISDSVNDIERSSLSTEVPEGWREGSEWISHYPTGEKSAAGGNVRA